MMGRGSLRCPLLRADSQKGAGSSAGHLPWSLPLPLLLLSWEDRNFYHSGTPPHPRASPAPQMPLASTGGRPCPGRVEAGAQPGARGAPPGCLPPPPCMWGADSDRDRGLALQKATAAQPDSRWACQRPVF